MTILSSDMRPNSDTLPRGMRRIGAALVGTLVSLTTVMSMGITRAEALIPVYGFPTLQLQRTIYTNPFVGAPAQHPGDAEGLAYDPFRNSMWVSDDSKRKLYELDFATGTLLTTLTDTQLANSTAFSGGGPPAGITRPADFEALAYDAVNDVLYAFAGFCCLPNTPHDPTVFRLIRGADGHFGVGTYQPLESVTYNGQIHKDMSGAGAINGELWVGDNTQSSFGKTLYKYDYATNTITDAKVVPGISGHITGVGFSPPGANAPAGDDVWLTTSSGSILYRFTWPALTPVPNHSIQMKDLGLQDTRAVEVVGDTLVLADGWDFYPPNTQQEFALRIYTLAQNSPTASFTTSPTTLTGGAPFTVDFTDTSVDRPTTWTWDFGDSSSIVTAQHTSHTFTAPGVYTVKHTTSNPNTAPNPPSGATTTVTVNAAPSAEFSNTSPSGAAPQQVVFTDESTALTPITGWSWNFGDGTALSNLQHPTHTYATAGTFNVTLTASVSNPTAFNSITHQVVINSLPAASFTTNLSNPPSGLAPLDVSFTDTSTGLPAPTTWSWNFGDGTALSPERHPSHIYTIRGTYTVTLTATSATGVSQATKTIVATSIPTAAFTMSTNSGAAPLAVTMTNTSTGLPTPTYLWDFGDGSATSTSANPGHTFATPGVYTVTLTATSSAGSSTTTRSATVTGPPLASFAASATSGPAPLNIAFTDSSSGTPAVTGWSWNFGDGSAGSTSRNPTHVFASLGTYTITLTVTNASGSTSTTRTITVGSVGSYVGLTPARLVDTRPAATVDGRFSGIGRVGTQGMVKFPVLGRGGVPTTGAGSVVLNVTAIGPTAESYLTVWPAGATRPTASNLNYVAGQTFPNMVIVPLGANGEISMFNAAGIVDVAVDVLGYFPATSTFVGLVPKRLMDTRVGGATVDQLFQMRTPLGANGIVSVTVAGRGGVLPAGGGSVALNVTAVGPSTESYMTVWPTGQPMPTASNLNYRAGQTIPNMVIVPLGANGKVSLFNAAGTVDVLVDVLGFFPEDPGFTGLAPARLMDTRGGATIDDSFRGTGPVGEATWVDVVVLGRGGVPLLGVGSVALNVTAVGPTAESYMTVWPAGRSMPTASNLNYVAGDVFPNMVIVPVDASGRISLYNAVGSTHVLVDVLGWFPQ